MEMNSLTKRCRICCTEYRDGLNLFSEEARRQFLQAKIRKYLSFTVSLDDKLPKMVCTECCLKLDGFHKFATMALRNQDKLSKYVCSNVNKYEEKQTENNKSLLHTYLTKGIKEKDPESSESEVTEMEVRVDPMTILQYCTDEDDENKDEASNDKQDEPCDQKSLSKTENLSENGKMFLCQLCPRNFTSETALQMHMWGHPSQPKRILSFNNMQQQINQVVVSLETVRQIEENSNNNNNKCTDEDSDETEDDEFGEYCNKKANPCPICGKLISNKGNLKVHLETHRPKGRYACDICGRIFKTQCNLYRHKEYHGGVQYPCGVCGRVYPTNSTLRAHSITHSDLRPHGCPMCEKTFKRNQDLKFHINQHTGARPYQCPYCPKAFASSGNCFSHRKRMHPLEVERDRERAAKIMR